MDAQHYWESKIKFFSKFLGFDNVDDFQETLDETNKSEILKKKGIKVVQNIPVVQSMVFSQTFDQETDKKWFNLTKLPYSAMTKQQLLKLTQRGTYDPSKIMPWMAQDRCKINLKLYNIKRNQYRTMLVQNNPYRLQKMNQEVQILNIKQGNSKVAELIGILLIFRQDIKYSQTLLNIGLTVDEYLHHAPVIQFSLFHTICCSGSLLPFLTNSQEETQLIVSYIIGQIDKNCSSSSFFRRDNIPLHNFVLSMIQSFWLNISEQKSVFRQKILYYLLIHQLSVKAISKVCEATIVGLSRIFNQGNRDKSIQVLNFPVPFLDREVFLTYLFAE